MKTLRKPFHAVTLRALALIFMLLDHLWATIIPGNMWMTCVGRLAFPIFAFQAAEGYAHTSSYKQYLKRLALFGVISEIPFNLIMSGGWFDPFHQNVMFTLALGLLALRAMDRAIEAHSTKQRILSLLATVGWCLVGAVTFVDYGAYGVMMVLLFGLSRRLPMQKLVQLIGMVLINVVLVEGRMLILGPAEIPLQSFAVLSLPLIWLYNGEKGPRTKWIQYGSYLFYPAHMALLYAIWYFS